MVISLDSMEKLPLEPWEVGGELLDILSRGLYSDAKDAIREYAQNGIDAKASNIWVTVEGPRVVVRDDGEGMDWDTLRRARRLGMSDKNSQDNVGFRGIGLYAAFGMCDSLVVSTHQAGADEEFTLRFDFGSMRRILEQDRGGVVRSGVALADLLYEYAGFYKAPYPMDLGDRQFTVVTLEGVEQEYRAQLNDAGSLNTYLLNTLPAALPDREYGATVNEWLAEYAGIRPVHLFLRVGVEPEIPVQPDIVTDVDSPHWDWIPNSAGLPVAFVWYCYSPHRRRLGARYPGDDSSDASGFLLRSKGFTLGNRMTLKSFWPPLGGGTLYHHFTGEVHILDGADVFPNAARDDLEPGVAKQNLDRYLRDYFYNLNRHADFSREISNANDKTQGFDSNLAELGRKFDDENSDPFELHRQCRDYLDVLETSERNVLRFTRGRKAIQPTADQKMALDYLKLHISVWKKTANSLLQRSQRGHQSRRSASVPVARPQVAALSRSVDALDVLSEASPSSSFQQASRALRSAAGAHSVGRAVAVLDGLKAEGLELSDLVESSRKELRVLLGWSPTGPVSFFEVLNDAGFFLESEREHFLIEALDQGLVHALGGRGPQYEAALRSISDQLTQDLRLQ